MSASGEGGNSVLAGRSRGGRGGKPAQRWTSGVDLARKVVESESDRKTRRVAPVTIGTISNQTCSMF